MSDLTDFLTARLDEDEQVARTATIPDDPLHIARARRARSAFGERNNPDRALRQVAAMRAIVQALTTATRAERVSTARRGIYEWRYMTGPVDDQAEVVLTHLAAIWSDHPDYREDWKP